MNKQAAILLKKAAAPQSPDLSVGILGLLYRADNL
jgi:hypothetical protein